jgi:hypothetical protein
MAVDYGKSLISELKEVLAKRRKILEIFGTYKEMYWDLLDLLATSCGTDIDTAVSAFYLANYVMNTTRSEENDNKIVEDDEHVKNVLLNLIETRKYLAIDFESLIHLYTLIYDWAGKIHKHLVNDVRLLIKKKVIITNLVDVYAVPLFSYLEQTFPELDLRWAMAELSGGLNKRFTSSIYKRLLNKYPKREMKPEYYFDAGFYIVEQFVNEYLENKFQDKDKIRKLEVFGDIGRRTYEFGCSLFYELESRDICLNIAYDDLIVPNTHLNKELIKPLSFQNPENPFILRFAKFCVQIKPRGQRSEEKFLYIHHYQEEDQDTSYTTYLGLFNYLLLSNQDLNLQSISSYSKQRCIDIRGISKRFEKKEISIEYINNLLSTWIEMYIHNLQQEYNFLEMRDELREQGFIPIGMFKQEKFNESLKILLEGIKPITAKRMEMLGIRSSVITLDQINRLIDEMKFTLDHGFNIIQQILRQHKSEVEINIYPIEYLFEHKQLDQRHITMLFSVDDSHIAGLICQNEASLEFQAKAMKNRQILSKINQILTDLRIKSLQDTHNAKLNEYIQRAKETEIHSGTFCLKTTLKESIP